MRLFIIFRNRIGKPQRKQQLSVPSVSSVVNLLRYSPTLWKKLKSLKKMRFFDIAKKPRMVTNDANLLRFSIRDIHLFAIPKPSRLHGHNSSTRFLQRELPESQK